MSVISVSATTQPSNVPPRIKVDVTDSGTPAITAVSVQRTVNGVTTPVRTLDGNALVLVTSGSSRVGTIYDYEAPYGVPVTYSTVEYPAGVSSAVTLAVSETWLIHPGIPSRSTIITVQAAGERSRSVSRGVFAPMGRARPIVFTDGQRKSVEGTLSVLTQTDAQRVALDLLIEDAAVVLWNPAASKPWGMPPAYWSIGDIRESRPSRFIGQPDRIWDLPYIVVDAPAGGSQAQWTYADGAALFATYAAAQAAYPSYASSLAPPS